MSNPDWELTVKELPPDPFRSKLALNALFAWMNKRLPEIAERMGVPLYTKVELSPEEYARRHAAIKQFVLDNPWDTPIPEDFGRSPA